MVLFAASVLAWSRHGERLPPASEPRGAAPTPESAWESAPQPYPDEASRRAEEVAETQARLERQLREQIDAQQAARTEEQARRVEEASAQAVETAERDRERHERIVADRRQRALARAVRDVAITMYSTPWCGYCKRARAHMKQAGIPFTEHNIEADPEAKVRARLLNPRGGVPTFDIDGLVMVGFSRKTFDAKYKQAVERRMR